MQAGRRFQPRVESEDLDRTAEDGGEVPARDHGASRQPGGPRRGELAVDVARARRVIRSTTVTHMPTATSPAQLRAAVQIDG